MAGSSPNRKKTLWEKEKLLVTSNFSFSHIVFQRLVLQTWANLGKSCGSNHATIIKSENVQGETELLVTSIYRLNNDKKPRYLAGSLILR